MECEFCKKSFTKATILNHIASSHLCKMHYGPRFLEMKKNKRKEKMQNWRKLNKEEKLEKQRKIYAESLEEKEKKTIHHEEKQSELAKKEGLKYETICKQRKKMAEKNDETIKGN